MRADECLAVGKNNLFCDSDLELGARPCAPPAEGGERETVVAGSICVTWEEELSFCPRMCVGMDAEKKGYVPLKTLFDRNLRLLFHAFFL